MYIAKKAKHSLSLWVINWRTIQMLQRHPHLSEQTLHETNRISLFVLTRRNTQARTHTHTCGQRIQNEVLTNLDPCCTSRQCCTKRTFSFWLPFGDQNECCIGSVTETLKAMRDPALNVHLPFPEGRLEVQNKEKSTILISQATEMMLNRFTLSLKHKYL